MHTRGSCSSDAQFRTKPWSSATPSCSSSQRYWPIKSTINSSTSPFSSLRLNHWGMPLKLLTCPSWKKRWRGFLGLTLSTWRKGDWTRKRAWSCTLNCKICRVNQMMMTLKRNFCSGRAYPKRLVGSLSTRQSLRFGPCTQDWHLTAQCNQGHPWSPWSSPPLKTK